MAWTKDQERGIFEGGKNIIVSAGAGSGKTAVLSERILEYCKAGGDIRRVLVLTFTNKAAAEMKERIRKKLLKNNLIEASELIDAAYITTFDSYSLSLVKRYYYLLNVGNDLAVMDQAFISLKLKSIIDELFDEKYEQNDEKFLAFIESYLRKNDTELRGVVYSICMNLDLIIDLDEFYNKYLDTYFSEKKINEIEEEYKKLANDSLVDYIQALEELYDWIINEPKQDKLIEFLEGFIPSLKAETDYYKLKVMLDSKLPRLANGSTAKDLKDNCTNKLKEIKKYFSYDNLDDIKGEIFSTKDNSYYLLSLAMEAISRLDSYKREVNRYSFSDIAKMAIKLVKTNAEVRNELKYYYNQILVDEYQDTSDLQETFLLEIENDNRYMVGDIKQSIYRFRNANPYIFKEKYDRYALNDGGIKIDLTYNFRSRNEVVNNINLLFNSLMTNELGDADYKNDHQMQFGQKNYLNVIQEYDFNLESLCYDYDFKEGNLTAEEVEAFIAAKKIKDIIDSKVKVLDGESARPATYDDFAVLISTATSFQTFKQVFEYCNVPLAIEADLDLKKSILPMLFSNILTLLLPPINYQNYNHALASVARSFLYQYSDEDIFKMIRLKESFEILEDIKYLKKYINSDYITLFFEICSRMKVYDRIAIIGDTIDSLAALENVYKMFVMFNDLQMTPNDARDYLVTVMNSDINYKYKIAQETKGHVKIMTIHASKGLEFPFCIFPMLSKRFNDSDSKKTMGFSRKYGVYLPASGAGEADTIIRELNNRNIRLEDLSERIRLFYVALTRAREKIILIRNANSKEIEYSFKIKSYENMLNYIKVYNGYNVNINLEDYNLTSDYKIRKKISTVGGNDVLEYDHCNELEMVSKKRISKQFDKVMTKEDRDNVNLGLLFHSAMESIDFANPDIDSLPVDDFIKNKVRILLNSEILKNASAAKAYYEYEFYMTKDNEKYHGIIDLLLDYSDHIDIIDYKLSHTDSPEYVRQLKLYQEFASSKSKKPVNIYLLSVLNSEIKKII